MKSALIVIALLSSAAWGKDIVVEQKDRAFSVNKVEAKLGDRIIFKNMEKDREHNLFSTSPGNQFEVPVQEPGQDATVALETDKHKAGEMVVQCAIHRQMRMIVEIKDK